MALAKLKADTTQARLAGLAVPQGLETARKDALNRLAVMGLPGKRDEYWKYTDPTTMTDADALPAAIFDAGEPLLFDAVARIKIVFVDGVFDPDASDDLAGEGVEIARLGDACPTLKARLRRDRRVAIAGLLVVSAALRTTGLLDYFGSVFFKKCSNDLFKKFNSSS